MTLSLPRSITYVTDGHLCRITLNRPEVLNALDGEMLAGLACAIRELEGDDDLRVGILLGSGGRAFSTGIDLKEMAAATSRQTSAGARAFEPVRPGGMPGFDEVRACAKPLIAAIDGHCLAGGLELALACDIRICSQQSRFGLPEPRRSLIGGPGLHGLSRMIPLGEALHLQLTGRSIAAQRAFEIGLVQEVAPNARKLDEAADRMAEDIVACAPLAVRAIKRIVRGGRDLPEEYSWRLGEPYQDAVSRSEDAFEGPRAFAEKRPPVWLGR